MEWKHDPAIDAYILIMGDVRCRVWRGREGWEAIVSHRFGGGEAFNSLSTVEAARAWCEAQLAAQQAAT